LRVPVRFVRGDLFAAGSLRAIAHGCNCAGAMGKGIAVEFRRRFPAMYEEYRARCADGRFGLGDVFAWSADGRTVFNLGTQKTWRTKAKLADVEMALRAMVKLAERDGVTEIGLPRIGAGLGALPWADVRSVIERIGAQTRLTLVVFEDHASGAAPRDISDGDRDPG
jgi:O-acetyl-ADP-ribose deacetylase (regulator of RNase III)